MATRLPESNADAGTALDTDRSGRIQVSELKYGYSWSGRRAFTFGFAGRLPLAEVRGRWNMVLASSHGIADNSNLSYSHVFNVTDDDKGAFAGAEAAWPSERLLVRIGAWVNVRAVRPGRHEF